MPVFIERISSRNSTTWICGLRKPLGNLGGSRTQGEYQSSIRVHDISDCRRRGTAVGGIDVRREVARAHRNGGNKRRRIQGSLARGRTLIADKEKNFVIFYWAADSASELVALQLI